MKLSPKEAAEARTRALAYEANMAVEGMALSPDGRKLADYIDASGIGYEEGRQMIMDDLRRRGIIPADQAKPVLAAE